MRRNLGLVFNIAVLLLSVLGGLALLFPVELSYIMKFGFGDLTIQTLSGLVIIGFAIKDVFFKNI